MKKVKYLIVGFVTGVLLAATMPTIAAYISKNIEVLTGVSVYVDGRLFEPKDALGNPIETFSYNGNTYVPSEEIAKAWGKSVHWVGDTQSLYLTSPVQQATALMPSPTPIPTPEPPLPTPTPAYQQPTSERTPNPWDLPTETPAPITLDSSYISPLDLVGKATSKTLGEIEVSVGYGGSLFSIDYTNYTYPEKSKSTQITAHKGPDGRSYILKADLVALGIPIFADLYESGDIIN